MKTPTMLYKAGGKHEIHGGKFDYTIVDESEVLEALDNGWFLTTTDALKATVKESLTTEASPAAQYLEDVKDAPRRGRPRKVTEPEAITDDL